MIAIIIADEPEADSVSGFVDAAQRIAGRVGGCLSVLVIGAQKRDAIVHTALRAGARTVLMASHRSLATPVQTEQMLAALREALPLLHEQSPHERALFVFSAGAIGEELSARLAVRMGGVALGRCSDIEILDGRVIAHRRAYGSRVAVHLASAKRLNFATIHASRQAAQGANASSAPVAGASLSGGALRSIELTVPLPSNAPIKQVAIAGKQKRLEGARLIVCGGRGVGGPEGFAQLGALADALGAALAGTLPAIDAGWIPLSRQVGQSGRYVTPEIYIAVGVSGTPQHMAGIGPDTRVVAINIDPDAAIFSESEVGVVADWRTIVPAVTERLAQRVPQP